MSQTGALISELKRVLREQRITYQAVAAHLGLSEASVKRLFAEQKFSLVRLEQVLELAQLEITDLVERLHASREFVSELTPDQEQALVEDPQLFVIALLVLNRWSADEILNTYSFSARDLQRQLIRLDRLKMIELLPFNRYRLLTARNFMWQKNGPVQKLFASQIQTEFFNSAFAGPGERLRFVAGTLSPDSITQLHREIDRLAARFDELVERDTKLPLERRYGSSAVFAFRPMEYSMFAQHRRAPGKKLVGLPKS